MAADQFDAEKLLQEVTYRVSRSAGKGGQNVNKVSTRVELVFNISGSAVLNAKQKEILLQKLATRLSADGELQLSSQETRSQLQNKKKVNEKFLLLITKSLKQPKKRVATKTPAAVKEKRLLGKRLASEKKEMRKNNIVE